MIRLFHEFRTKIRESRVETAVVLEGKAGACTVVVDAVEAVESLNAGSLGPIPESAASADHLVAAIGRRQLGEDLVLILDVEHLVRELAAGETNDCNSERLGISCSTGT